MVKLCINNGVVVKITANNYIEITQHVTGITNLAPSDFYLEQNGKLLLEDIDGDSLVYVRLRTFGGKGGFGSMLRAIGAQIEKTTNREACRDLSGRRLRDINEEKRLKAWLEKQGEREREAEERKKRKIEKLLAVPKHEFKDAEYEQARSKLTEKVCDAVEEGFKKASTGAADLKRRNESSTSQQSKKIKKKRPGLWLDDLSSDDSDDSVDSDESEKDKNIKPATTKNKDSKNCNTMDKSAEAADSQESEACKINIETSSPNNSESSQESKKDKTNSKEKCSNDIKDI